MGLLDKDIINELNDVLDEGEYVIKHKLFKFEGVGNSANDALLDFISKLKEYKNEYEQITKDKKKKGSNLAKQYAILKKLENENYERNFVLES